jgi:hypothetical protein
MLPAGDMQRGMYRGAESLHNLTAFMIVDPNQEQVGTHYALCNCSTAHKDYRKYVFSPCRDYYQGREDSLRFVERGTHY